MHRARFHAGANRFARVKMALLLALRGNVIVYQGEELGLRQDHIPFDQLQDPEAIANWPMTLGRDGARTPMPWRSDAPLGGFTTGQPWLPLSEQNLALSVASQQADRMSLLHETQRLLALRRSNAALRTGRIENVIAKGSLLMFDRVAAGQHLRCLFNLSPKALKPPPVPAHAAILASLGGATPTTLPDYSAIYLTL